MDRSVITYVLKCDKCMSLLEHHGTTLQEKLQLKATDKEEKEERLTHLTGRIRSNVKENSTFKLLTP